MDRSIEDDPDVMLSHVQEFLADGVCTSGPVAPMLFSFSIRGYAVHTPCAAYSFGAVLCNTQMKRGTMFCTVIA
jgi:hypothetical protein